MSQATADTWWPLSTTTVADVRAAIAAGADVDERGTRGNTPLMLFVLLASEDPEWVQLLLDAGADVEAVDDSGITPLMYAAGWNHNPEVVRMLLDAGADVAAVLVDDGQAAPWAPLMLAALLNPSPEVVRLLLEATPDGVDARSMGGVTPLMAAATMNETPDVFRVLLAAGSDVAARSDDGMTPLMHAAESNPSAQVIRILLEAGADVDARTDDDRTALMVAARSNSNPDVIVALLDAGADILLRDVDGQTAFDHAQVNDAVVDTGAYWRLDPAADGQAVTWAQRYRDATPISDAEFLERVPSVRVSVRAAPYVTQRVPIEDILDLVVARVRAHGLRTDPQAPITLHVDLRWADAEYTLRRNGIETSRSPIHATEFTLKFEMTAPILRDGAFYMAQFAPVTYTNSGAARGEYDRRFMRDEITSRVDEALQHLRTSTRPTASQSTWRAALGQHPLDPALHQAYIIARESDSYRMPPVLAGMVDVQPPGFTFHHDANQLVRSTRGLEDEWRSRLHRLDLVENASSRSRITHVLQGTRFAISSGGAALFGSLANPFYALISRVHLEEDAVAFELNGEYVLMDVVHSTHSRLQVALPRDADLEALARQAMDAFLTEKFEEAMAGWRARR